MRNSTTSSTSDGIPSKGLIADFSTTINSNASSDDFTGSSLESSHSSFLAATSNVEGTPSDNLHVSIDAADVGSATTGTYGLTTAETVDTHQEAQGNGSAVRARNQRRTSERRKVVRPVTGAALLLSRTLSVTMVSL